MIEYKTQCYELANTILNFIRHEPHVVTEYGYSYPVGKWSISYIANNIRIEYLQLQDILAILKEHDYIQYEGDTIEITTKGRIFILDGGYQIDEEIEYEESESGLLVPQKDKSNKGERVFNNKIPEEQKKRLVDFFAKGEYVNDPAGLVDFLCGKNDGRDLELNTDKDKLTELCLLLEALDNKDWLELTFGKGYQKFFEEHIRPFSLKKEKGQQIKSKIKRMNNKSWDKNTRKDFKDFLHSLKILYILYLLS